MAIRLTIGGVLFECDTVEEARALAGERAPAPIAKGQTSPKRPASRKASNGFADRHVKLIKILIRNPDGVTDKDIRKGLGLESNRQLSGIMGAFSRKMNSDFRLAREDVIAKEHFKNDEDWSYVYKPRKKLEKLAREVGIIK